MNCKDVQPVLEAFLNGKLSGKSSLEVRTHLASCSECSSNLGALDRIELLPALDEQIEPDSEICARFSTKLEQHRNQRAGNGLPARARWWHVTAWGWPRRLAAAGALAALATVSVYLGRYPANEVQSGTFSYSELEAAENLPLLRDMALISDLDLLENLDTIDALPADPMSLSDR